MSTIGIVDAGEVSGAMGFLPHILRTLIAMFSSGGRYKVLLVGTCRKNRKGWPGEMMTLDTKQSRGAYKIAYCLLSDLACMQWCDSKVVNCVSAFLDFRVTTIERQIGSTKKRFDCPQMLRHYQEHMGGVDRGDQMRLHFGGFAGQSHFKKWYKKTLMAICDCMILNGL